MQAIFDQKNYRDYLRGYTIYDCSINNQDRYCFLLVEEAENRDILPRTRFVLVLGDRPPAQRFGMYETGNLRFTTLARGTAPLEYVAVDTVSQVYSSNAQRKGEEKPIDQLIDMKTARGHVGIIKKVVRAADQVYALGDFRKIYQRIGMEQWIELGMEGKGVPMPADVETGKTYPASLGFQDMSAFAPDDLYAVGGHGDVWQFDGKQWRQCALPTNAPLATVCCAGDGNVYISEMNGSVWAGRGDLWERVATGDIAWGYQPVDAVWFNGRLYLGSQEGLWGIDSKNRTVRPLRELESGAPSPTNSGRLDLSPDGKFLLTAGPYGACLHDGAGWKRLFSTFDFI